MTWTTAGNLLKDTIYAFVYGANGAGKTMLATTLADPAKRGADLGYITAEPGGPTSLVSHGFSSAKVKVLPAAGVDPFPPIMEGLNRLGADPAIKVICLDGFTMIAGRAIMFMSHGKGEKALGYPGWQEILNQFRTIEFRCEKLVRENKSVVMTAWEREPEYEDTLAGPQLKSEGRPWIQGQARDYLPGNCDIVARLTGKYKKVIKKVNGKDTSVKQWVGELQVNRRDTNQWLAKSRWPLPDPCPGDLRNILKIVKETKK